MGVNAPEPAYFWDDTSKTFRKAVTGEAGEYIWNGSAWEFGTIGAEYVWNGSTRSWDFGPGGQYVWNSTTRAWDKNTTRGGGPYYWDDTNQTWLPNTGVGAVGNDLLLETGDHLLLETGDAILLDA